MYSNIGKKIKGLVKVAFVLVALASVITGIVFICVGDLEDVIGLIIAVAGTIIAWISSWFLYGFGELIDKVSDIERNTSGSVRQPEAQPRVDHERMNRLKKLKAARSAIDIRRRISSTTS